VAYKIRRDRDYLDYLDKSVVALCFILHPTQLNRTNVTLLSFCSEFKTLINPPLSVFGPMDESQSKEEIVQAIQSAQPLVSVWKMEEIKKSVDAAIKAKEDADQEEKSRQTRRERARKGVASAEGLCACL
jgi:hypothetical protein